MRDGRRGPREKVFCSKPLSRLPSCSPPPGSGLPASGHIARPKGHQGRLGFSGEEGPRVPTATAGVRPRRATGGAGAARDVAAAARRLAGRFDVVYWDAGECPDVAADGDGGSDDDDGDGVDVDPSEGGTRGGASEGGSGAAGRVWLVIGVGPGCPPAGLTRLRRRLVAGGVASRDVAVWCRTDGGGRAAGGTARGEEAACRASGDGKGACTNRKGGKAAELRVGDWTVEATCDGDELCSVLGQVPNLVSLLVSRAFVPARGRCPTRAYTKHARTSTHAVTRAPLHDAPWTRARRPRGRWGARGTCRPGCDGEALSAPHDHVANIQTRDHCTATDS